MEDAFYQVLESYIPEPDDVDGLAVQKNDVIVIFSSKSSLRKGRAYALNTCSRQTGYIPIDIVKHFPPGKENSTLEVWNVENKKHTLASHNVINPMFCIHCLDYIWGSGKILMKCAGNFYKKNAQ